MLYGIVFLGGAVLMSLEMLGSRLLAPTFGSSIYVWGSLITVVMAALTLGYYLGGKAADKRPAPAVLGLILFAAGLFIGSLPLWVVPLNNYLGRLEPRAGSLLAALSFFFLPSLLLAMISPYSVKLAGLDLAKIGGTAGRMSAVSSAGSILGTLATSFFLIPAMGVRSIVYMLGLILFVLSAAAFLWARRLPRATRLPLPILAGICLILAAINTGFWLWGRDIWNPPHPPGTAVTLLARDTLYHRLVVDQIGNERHLHFDRSWQSAMDVTDPSRMVFWYTSYLHLGAVVNPRPKRMLCIGLGGGSAPARFLRDYPSLELVDVVEIDPVVIEAARDYFQLPRDPRLRVTAQDGRLYVERMAGEVERGRAEPYDFVIIDAFNSDAIPYHLTTREFLAALRRVVTPDAPIVSNIIAAMTGPHSRLIKSMTRTFADVFPQVYLFPIGGWSGQADDWERNIILIATRDAERWDAEQWREKAFAYNEAGLIEEPVSQYVQDLVEHPEYTDPGVLAGAPLLTDDYAPVDTLQNPL